MWASFYFQAGFLSVIFGYCKVRLQFGQPPLPFSIFRLRLSRFTNHGRLSVADVFAILSTLRFITISCTEVPCFVPIATEMASSRRCSTTCEGIHFIEVGLGGV